MRSGFFYRWADSTRLLGFRKRSEFPEVLEGALSDGAVCVGGFRKIKIDDVEESCFFFSGTGTEE